MPVNQWHVANWLEYRAPREEDHGWPMRRHDRRSRQGREEYAEYEAKLARDTAFSARTFGPTIFPDKAATWPLPRERYVADASGWIDPLVGFGMEDNEMETAPDKWATRPARFHDTPKSPYMRCLIEAGGGLKVIHPLTGEEMTLVQAKDSMNRYEGFNAERRRSDYRSFEDFPWHDDSGAKQGSEYQAVMLALMTIQPMESNLQDIYKSHGSQDDGLTTEAAQAMYEAMMSYLTDGPLPQLQTMEGMGIVGPDPENYRRVKQKIANILPREINSWRDIVSLRSRLLKRFEELQAEDARVVDAILDAEEDAIKRGMVSGDCPPPEEGFREPRPNPVTQGPTIQGTLGPPRPAFGRPDLSEEERRRFREQARREWIIRPEVRPEPTEEEIGEALYENGTDSDQPYGDQMETDWIQDEPTDE